LRAAINPSPITHLHRPLAGSAANHPHPKQTGVSPSLARGQAHLSNPAQPTLSLSLQRASRVPCMLHTRASKVVVMGVSPRLGGVEGSTQCATLTKQHPGKGVFERWGKCQEGVCACVCVCVDVVQGQQNRHRAQRTQSQARLCTHKHNGCTHKHKR